MCEELIWVSADNEQDITNRGIINLSHFHKAKSENISCSKLFNAPLQNIFQRSTIKTVA